MAKLSTFILLLMIFCFQGAFGACKKIPDMPTARRNTTTALSEDGRIFVMGGINADDHYTNEVEAYDPATNQWSKFSSLPKNMIGMSSIVGADGLIYVFGGLAFDPQTRYTELTSVLVFDPKKNQWQQRKDMPLNKNNKSRDASIVRSDDGRIWILGGFTSAGMIYDSKKDSWQVTANMNTARTGFGLVHLADGRFFALGGTQCDYNPPLQCENDEVYDPKTNEWTLQNSHMINDPQNVFSFKAKDEKVFAIPNDINKILPIEVYDLRKQSWSVFMTPKDLGWGFSAKEGQDGMVYLFGAGVNKRDDRGYYSTALGHVNTFNPNTGEWCGQ